MLCTLIRGQMSYTFFQLGGGAHVLLCQLLGGQMSSYAIFHRGAHVRGGGGEMSYTLIRQFSREPLDLDPSCLQKSLKPPHEHIGSTCV